MQILKWQPRRDHQVYWFRRISPHPPRSTRSLFGTSHASITSLRTSQHSLHISSTNIIVCPILKYLPRSSPVVPDPEATGAGTIYAASVSSYFYVLLECSCGGHRATAPRVTSQRPLVPAENVQIRISDKVQTVGHRARFRGDRTANLWCRHSGAGVGNIEDR